MKRLGFEFDDRKKSFYVDGHEREDVVANRKQFCTTYLTKLEPYCKRWIQIPINDAIGMANVDVEMGHRYFDIVKDTEHIEYHVDYWNRFGGGTDVINPTTSIRVSSNARPIMIIGQDESVFSQYLMGAKTWIARTVRDLFCLSQKGMDTCCLPSYPETLALGDKCQT
ncbi:hypothetical protein MHU86_18994 [Fragilaria crotonensis]|nr:hypothetical protein MHU86_18994 [Fragilaria crotonensis]